MSEDLKEDRTSPSDRRIIRQIGDLLVCLACSLFLTNCAFLAVVENAVESDGYSRKLTQYRNSFQSDDTPSSKDASTSTDTGSESPTQNDQQWATTWSVLASTGYVVTVPADIPRYSVLFLKDWYQERGQTAKFTEYRRSLLPRKAEYTETTCTFQGTVQIASQEYLSFHTKDFANWDRNSEGITYLLPRQGNGPALIQTMNSPVQKRPNKPVGIVFDLDEKLPQDNLESQQKEKTDFYLVRLETDTKLSLSKPDILLYVCATRSGEGTRITLFTRNKTKWDLSKSYVVEQPIQDNLCWTDTKAALSSAGYLVTVMEDTALVCLRVSLLAVAYTIVPPVAGW